MTDPHPPSEDPTLTPLGWSAFFEDRIAPDETDLARMRIARVHRSHLGAMTEAGPARLHLPPQINTADFAVGDWILADPGTHTLVRRLERRTLLQRRTAGARDRQLIAANVDTLFIVTSCNADFNPARLERYLALANEAGISPVIVLTKADTVTDALPYRKQAAGLQRHLAVVALNAKAPDAAEILGPWCGAGQTVALVGSSGVGKSTLLNTLAADAYQAPQLTGDVRKGDAKGRHTTTGRSLHAIKGGGWVIDTPGMRTLQVSEAASGLEMLFAEITELAPHCRFRDCTHAHEPGCAVQAAVAAGTLDPARLDRWRKLQGENRDTAPAPAGTQAHRPAPGRRGRR